MATPASIDLSAAMITAPVPPGNWLVVLPVVLCVGLGALLLILRDRTSLHGWIAISGLVLLVLIDAGLLYRVANEGPVTMVMGRWLPPFGIAFTVDLFGALMALAAAIVGLAAAVAALGDIEDVGRRYGFYPFLMLLLAGVSGAFLTGDIFNLYVWFEVLLISSFGLLILGSEREQIDGALKYAVLNLIATTIFLIAVGYLYAIFGTLNMADIAAKARQFGGTAPLMTLAALFFIAFGMKAAAFPVNFWLPASYHTPRIVVSALFAGLLTKVGIYSMIRVLVMLFPVERAELASLVGMVAGLTMIVGALGALSETDMRRLFGYVVISGIGNMLAGIALGGADGIDGAIVYALHSIILMTALYLVAGEAARLGGSYSVIELGGLWRRSGWFAGLSLVLFLAASGLPPFSGFWPKVILVKAALDAGSGWLAGIILLTGFLNTIAFGRLFLLAYWRPRQIPVATGQTHTGAAAQSPAWQEMGALGALTALIIAVGLFPEPLLHLTEGAARNLTDPAAYLASVFPGGGQ
ncbi:Na+/H+ antiporter subunit D [Neorhizobium sp. P12A]|uniref:Na+/H+ antiporter subunit D n=1 Tax=Neorhizobium sp. P12A TaxID=2268027 RepID=UPI0011ED5E09|nr:Na+/H+ antiporter subunit D [Neorhizobium sp. P12A]KAA0699924.1 Na+/H+ antiporter subunit D [Neorhizobium sp. P12A]